MLVWDLMLENITNRLRGKGMPHEGAPSKEPKTRLEVLNNAGITKNSNDYWYFGRYW